MKCHACNATVADDAAVCPQCDAVLDPSLLDAAPPEDDGEAPAARTAAHRPPSRPASRPGAKKVARKPGARPAPRPKAPAPSPPPAPKASSNWRDQISEAEWKESAGRAPERFEVDRGLDPDDALVQTKRYLFELPSADKLALFGASAMLLATFFPWKETVAEGEVLGVYSSGIVVTVLAALAVAGLIVRTTRAMPALNPLLPWVAQLGCVGASGVWCLVYMQAAWDPTLARSPIGNYEIWVSKPTFGVIFALLAAIVAIAGTVLGLKDLGKR